MVSDAGKVFTHPMSGLEEPVGASLLTNGERSASPGQMVQSGNAGVLLWTIYKKGAEGDKAR